MGEPGDQRGTAAAEAAHDAEGDVLEEKLVAHLLPPRHPADRRVGAVVALGQRPTRVGDVIELEVVVVLDVGVEVLEHVVEAQRLFDGVQVERFDALQRHRRQHTKGAEPDTGAGEDLGLLVARAAQDRAVAGDQLEADDLGGQPTQLDAGAVRCRRHRARDRLVLDVTEVRQRPAEFGEAPVQRADRAPGLHRDLTPLAVDRNDLAVAVELEPPPVGARDVGERVARSDRFHGLAGGTGCLHGRDYFGLVGRVIDGLGRTRLVAAPVGPQLSHERGA